MSNLAPVLSSLSLKRGLRQKKSTIFALINDITVCPACTGGAKVNFTAEDTLQASLQDFFFFYIKHLHSNIKPRVTRHTYINSYAREKTMTYKKGKKRAVTYM